MMATRKRSVVVAAALAAILSGVFVVRAAGPFKGHASMVFLCTNGAPPAGVPTPPPCPQGGGTVSGELTAADVLAVGASGVAAGDFDAFVDALRAEAGYGNLHSAAFTNGEIRGQVTFSRADSISDN